MKRRDFLLAAGAVWPALALAQTAPASGPASALETAWGTFANKFVTNDGRVVDTGNQGITHTEGLGIAMLAAQACNDRARFDKMRTFARGMRRGDGLFAWKWVPGKGVADANNATDGDIYIAWALLRAGLRWQAPGLVQEAMDLARVIRTQCIANTSGGKVLLPGVDGFIQRSVTGVERAVVNPSYWVLPAMRELQAVDPAPAWAELHQDALRLLEASRFGPQALPADWVLLEDPPVPWRDRPARFGYEAVRVPLFLVWAQKSAHPITRACARHMQTPGFPAWVALDSSERAPYAAPAGFEAVARLLRKTVYGEPLALPPVDNDYYSSALVLLSLLAAQDLGWA